MAEGFKIDTHPKMVKIPDFTDRKQINIRYPLLPPYAYAHIFWDDKNGELIYFLEEPELTDVEKEVLKLVQMGLEEMINISFAHAAKFNLLIQYLEQNVQSILTELGTKVSEESYNKIMYYIYRDSVGLNRVEALMNDQYIEDIECNGATYPIYIVHRKFENLKSNISYENNQELMDFVEKLAQKSNRYVSYAKPLLDGTLPDGSRVNATYTEDVTTRGPTFTIRKFTKDPWTPTHLIEFNTASAEVFAYLWLAIEYKFNVMVIGETASGKTTFLNSMVHFIPPEARVCSIEDTRELNLAHDNWLPAVTRTGFGMSGEETTFGEITLFDLLKETFRQNPDYVIVGEIRGKEAYVLFQGMASGHPSFGTFHAGSVQTLVRRLHTPPISLPSSLVESLDIVCVCSHIKTRNQNIRRLKELEEVIAVGQDAENIKSNRLFSWSPTTDKFQMTQSSVILQKISMQTGISIEEIWAEFNRRKKLLLKLVESKTYNFKNLNKIVSDYYQKPKQVLQEYGIH